MKVMVSINAGAEGTQKAEELKGKLEDLFKQYGLEGSVRGDKYQSGAAYTGTYQKKAKKAKPAYDPKYDPSQYFKGKEYGKKHHNKKDEPEE